MNTLLDTLKMLGPVRLAAIGAVGAGTIAFFIYLTTQLASEDMSLLYADLDSSDSAEVVSELEQRGIPYELSADGSRVLVPSSRVAGLRVQMAEQGVPSGGSVGYEIFDDSGGLGTTNFVQNVNHVRALEGELARTIRSIDGVQQARVHLVMPRRELFSRDRQEPSASIVLLMRGNNRLSDNQVLGVQHLVASAIPDLQPNLVSIVDQQGTLLARGGDSDNLLGGQLNAQEVKAEYEQRVARSLEQLLERSVGVGNVRAEVAADMNFDRITENQEIFDPDSQIERSRQIMQEEDSSIDGPADQPVTVDNNLPDVDFDGPADTERMSQSESSRSEQTINYELSRTTRTLVSDGGDLERLSVAILIDGRYVQGANGERLYEERTAEELEQIAALARSAVGYDEERGDQIEVINMQFADPVAELMPEETATFLGLPYDKLMRAAELLVLGLVAVLVLLLVVRPLVSRLLESAAADQSGGEGSPRLANAGSQHPQLAAPGGPPAPAGGAQIADFGIEDDDEDSEQLIDLNKVEGRVRASSVRKIGEIVEKHPEEAVSIIRNWLYQQQT